MALTDIVFKGGNICCEENRGNTGTLIDINFKDTTCCELNRGNVGTLVDIVYSYKTCIELIRTLPSIGDVRIGIKYGANGLQFTGTLVVGGAASSSATLLKITGDLSRSGTGSCAQLTPTSTTTWGYWHLYIPVTISTPITLTFYQRISTNWNGQLKVTIYDTDQTTVLLSSQTVTLINNGAYNLYTATPVTPSTTGMCLLRVEIIDGSTTGYALIDDIGLN